MDDPHTPATDGDNDAFAPLNDADRARARNIPRRDGEADDMVMLPCPREMPPREYFCLWDGRVPSHVWAYRNEVGMAMVVAARYDTTTSDGSYAKEVRPWTYGRRCRTGRNGERQVTETWHAKA